MIFKVQGDFTELDFEKCLDKLSRYFNIIYFDGVLYLAVLNYTLKGNLKGKIKKCLDNIDNIYISLITSSNINKQSEVIKDWAYREINRLKGQQVLDSHIEDISFISSFISSMSSTSNNE